MGGRREVSIIFYRPVTRSDLKQERSFFRGSVSSFLQLVVVVKRRGEKIAVDTRFYDWSYSALALLSKNTPHKHPLPYPLSRKCPVDVK